MSTAKEAPTSAAASTQHIAILLPPKRYPLSATAIGRITQLNAYPQSHNQIDNDEKINRLSEFAGYKMNENKLLSKMIPIPAPP